LYKISDVKAALKQYNPKIEGLFSYSRMLYGIPLLGRIVVWMEYHIKLPVSLRRQIFVVIKKE
jgi:hypothetical protein